MDGARRFWFCVGAAPQDFSSEAACRFEFRGFENRVVGKPIPRHLRRGALYARSPAMLKAESESEDFQIRGCEDGDDDQEENGGTGVQLRPFAGRGLQH